MPPTAKGDHKAMILPWSFVRSPSLMHCSLPRFTKHSLIHSSSMIRCFQTRSLEQRFDQDIVEHLRIDTSKKTLFSRRQTNTQLQNVLFAAFFSLFSSASSEAVLPTSVCSQGQTCVPSSCPLVKVGGLSISRLIQGHWQLSDGNIDTRLAVENIQRHASAGITTLDTADIYGPSEAIIGEFLAANSTPKIVVCTKFCCFRGLDRITREEVRQRILASCKRLGVSKLDLVAFFWLDFGIKNYVTVARYLTELKAEGLISEIGVTNFDTEHLRELVDAGIPVVSNQVNN